MPKKRSDLVLTPEQIEAEKAGQAELYRYFRSGVGRQKEIAQASGIFASLLSRMACGHHPINLEAAVQLEVATKGELRVETLCPTRAEVFGKLLALRSISEPA